MGSYEFETPEGKARAFYQVQTTNQTGGFYETFHGDNGSLVIPRSPRGATGPCARPRAEWDSLVKDGLLLTETQPSRRSTPEHHPRRAGDGRSRPLAAPGRSGQTSPPAAPGKFFNAVRLGTPLSCPAELASRAPWPSFVSMMWSRPRLSVSGPSNSKQ